MKRTVHLALEVDSDITDPVAIREELKKQVDAMLDEDIAQKVSSSAQVAPYFIVGLSADDKSKIAHVSDGVESFTYEQFMNLAPELQSEFAVVPDTTLSVALLRTNDLWVAEGDIGEHPVVAEIRSDDSGFIAYVDIRPWLRSVDASQLAEMIRDDFADAYRRDEIYHFLEKYGDPSATAMSAHLTSNPVIPISRDPNGFEVEIVDEDRVREWATTNRPDVGWTLINQAPR
ncbi:hypothetical protein [Salipiger sp. PrR003]|uniref:hypothetical protein n=1 Tax=Salipiger sp. PrR003 TaxID=2706776 RepID=UPI0013DAEC8F|nr:hypothetical protein [Salipiger sp. PrR003]NDV50376.1 hypothetical protein [Salipiger sp. PrR003]